ncbi:CHAT domain-containing protein [Coprinopsis sp. MPI-PUGE-AT-0042]|nr:CHAT domain-containing protein [Coprinopsis sp. MPI-PUGE-AT-0042]
MRQYGRTGDLVTITEAITVLHRAVQLTPEGHAGLPTVLNNLGNAFQRRFEYTGDLSDIVEAISTQQRSVQLTPEGHANLPACLNNLGTSFRCRFKHTGDLSDIAKAISAQHQTVQLTPEGHANLPTVLNNLGNSFQCRFEHTGDLSDNTEGITAQRRAVQLTPEGHPHLPARLNNLGNAFRCRFERTGDLSDIAEGVSAIQQAVQITPEGHANLPIFLNSLGISFQCRFGHTGDLFDIAEAISAQHSAVRLTPEDHANLPAVLSSLGNAFLDRFERTGDLSDIAEAISAQHRAVQLTPEGHTDLPGCLNNLGISFRCRFEHTGDLSDIAEAISAQCRTVQLTPKGHAHLPTVLNNLGISLQCRFKHTGDLSDIAKAISAQQQAVQLTPKRHANLPACLNNLGTLFQCCFERTGDLSDIAEAISVQRRAVQLTPGGHAGLPARLSNLGNMFRHCFERTRSKEDLAASILNYKSAATSSFGPPQHQLEAARAWAHLLNEHDPQSPDILHAFDTALALIALIAGLEESLQDISGIALKAASAACYLGRADKALEWLEQGRCIVWSQLSNLRTPLDNLRLHNSQLAQSLADDEARAHLNLARHWDDLLKTVRSIPGFESFLQPLPCSSLLQHLPVSGPVVVINVDERRPQKQNQMQPQVVVRRVLRDLWNEVVSPILNALGFSVSTWIWWCPTGPLSFLPLHAAGTHSDRMLDYAVSSYIPTVTALTDRVKNCQQINKDALGLFLISQPYAPGTSPIPGTTKEAQSIFRMAAQNGAKAAMLKGSTLTVDECLQYMQHYSCVHLACHASQNAAKPLKSQFIFHNGSLDLATIIRRDLKNADLAFLSACQTSAGDEKLSDEAVHLAAGMLAAGYRRVVATMWSIGDRNAPEVANDFYHYLFNHREEGSGSSVDGSISAYALHHAVQRLRGRLDNSDDSLLAWVPYVHFGY